MRAAYVREFSQQDPAAGVEVGERPEPVERPGWTVVTVKAASVNQHDVFTARGMVIRDEQLPRILGMDAAGVDAGGNDVLVHNLVNADDWGGEPLLDPKLTGLSEGYDGAFAEQVLVPVKNVIAKPPELSFAEAACLPTAWLTAYRMLFVESNVHPGDVVLVQGASGGVSTALVSLGRAAGLRMWVTGRSEEKRAYAAELGAERTFEPNSRLPGLVDAVMETVGRPTWDHSLKSVRKGGRVVVAGGTGGYDAQTNLARVFVKGLHIVGSTMGTVVDLRALVSMLVATGVRPSIGVTLSLDDAAEGVRMLADGRTRGKVVLTVA